MSSINKSYLYQSTSFDVISQQQLFVPVHLLQCQKKDENDGGLRSIAIGCTVRRLAAKCANIYATAKLAPHFAPIQLGVGTPGRAETAIHAVRKYTENLPKDYIIVKLDFNNAFNTLRRDAMLGAIRRELTELYNFTHATCNGVL